MPHDRVCASCGEDVDDPESDPVAGAWDRAFSVVPLDGESLAIAEWLIEQEYGDCQARQTAAILRRFRH